MRATITELFIYPVKSAQAIPLRQATVLRTGLAGDRQWMVVDDTGHFVTQRQMSKLSFLSVAATPSGISLSCRGEQIALERAKIIAANDRRQVTVWSDTVSAYDCGDAAAAFLAATLGQNRGRPLRLVLQQQLRNVDPLGASALPATVAFADGYPFLVTTDASLADLQARIDREHPDDAETMATLRFRPNIVLSGLAPFAEDAADALKTAGGVHFRLVKPCSRCAITMIDPETGAKGVEPLRTLRTFRSREKGIMFGQNAMLIDGEGLTISIGDEVEVV